LLGYSAIDQKILQPPGVRTTERLHSITLSAISNDHAIARADRQI
jgi:hypothetical protein